MRRMLTGLTVALVLAGGQLGFSAGALAATQIVDSDGNLTGATGIDIGGTLYDVIFAGGSCADNFGGCDAVSDFNFSDSASAYAAARALLDQVFLDSNLGDFDTAPGLAAGCGTAAPWCNTYIPYAVNPVSANFPDGSFLAQSADNWSLESSDAVNGRGTGRLTDSGYFYNFAIFSAVTPAVPEPATWATMLLGLALVGGAMRSRRQASGLGISHS